MLGEIAKTYPLGLAHNGTGAMAGPLSMHQPQRCCLRTVAAGFRQIGERVELPLPLSSLVRVLANGRQEMLKEN